MKTRSQKLAQAALNVVRTWSSDEEGQGDAPTYNNERKYPKREDVGIKKQDLNHFARRFPALIQSSGLLPAFSFARDKNQTYAEGFKSVLAVLAPQIAGAPSGDIKTNKTLSEVEERLKKTTAEEYMRVSRNALEAATWIKRYAVASDD